MYAIIRQGNGKYYVSYVFGYYKNVTATKDYDRYIEEIHNPYWIVWDENKRRLIKWLNMTPDTQYLIPQMLIVDANQDNWTKNNDGEGCVSFLSKEIIDSIIDIENQPKEIINKCRSVDCGYVYNEYQEIQTNEDADNFLWATGNFHDAYIEKEIMQEDGTLYLRFKGVWGCEVEVWFWGDLEYDTSSRNNENCDLFWYGSTVILQDGFVYFVDETEMTVDLINHEYCYFKARHMKYHIIPD